MSCACLDPQKTSHTQFMLLWTGPCQIPQPVEGWSFPGLRTKSTVLSLPCVGQNWTKITRHEFVPIWISKGFRPKTYVIVDCVAFEVPSSSSIVFFWLAEQKCIGFVAMCGSKTQSRMTVRSSCSTLPRLRIFAACPSGCALSQKHTPTDDLCACAALPARFFRKPTY
jgi:hypothetical protein